MRYNITCEHIRWVEQHNAIFKGNAKLDKKNREELYLVYNQIFNDSKKPNGCGGCQRSVIDGIYKVYLKYKDKLCFNQDNQETLTDDQKG